VKQWYDEYQQWHERINRAKQIANEYQESQDPNKDRGHQAQAMFPCLVDVPATTTFCIKAPPPTLRRRQPRDVGARGAGGDPRRRLAQRGVRAPHRRYL
jgi:hypothetical protein